jgi:hypothetical protein
MFIRGLPDTIRYAEKFSHVVCEGKLRSPQDCAVLNERPSTCELPDLLEVLV